MTDDPAPCCGGGRGAERRGDRSADEPAASGAGELDGSEGGDAARDPDGNEPDLSRTVRLGGTFTMGTDDGVGYEADGEGPAREVTVDPFRIDVHAVTNAEFYRFVDETGYVTDAERFGWSYVFESFLTEEAESAAIDSPADTPWWIAVEGATWYRPEGPGSTIGDRLDHPVVHVSWNDAVAYAEWAGKRLPTEAEWELAARGGREGARFPWGDELEPDGTHRCNVWQGTFPTENTCEDGYEGTAPVDAFEPNGHGLYNPVGNVWEWCADRFSADYHRTSAAVNPTGPDEGTERSMRGGSYLCHDSYCNRYRVAARSKNTPDSSTGNIGFRCVADV